MRLPPSERTGPENTHAFVAELLGKDVHMTRVIYAQHPAPHDPSSELLVLSTGGKGIVMRHEDLRESTRLAAEKKVNKLETRLTPGEKSNRKRMAQVDSRVCAPCGDGVCSAAAGENRCSCPMDCP